MTQAVGLALYDTCANLPMLDSGHQMPEQHTNFGDSMLYENFLGNSASQH